MTQIKILIKQDIIVSLAAKGHTGFSEAGKDIICSAVSTIIQSTVLGLQKVVGLELKLKMKDGYLNFQLPEKVEGESLIKAKVLLDTLKLSLEDLQQAYPAYIQMEVL